MLRGGGGRDMMVVVVRVAQEEDVCDKRFSGLDLGSVKFFGGFLF